MTLAKLYEIDRRIMECVDMETGEIRDLALLDSLQIERTAKIEGIACYIKNLLSDADAIKAEKDALAKREAQKRRAAESYKQYLAYHLGGTEFQTARCAVSFLTSKSVEVDDIQLIPAELLRVKNTVEADKKAIKAAIEAGQEVQGCCLVEKLNTQIN